MLAQVIAKNVGNPFIPVTCMHAYIHTCRAFCLSVRALTGKRLELSTPNFVRVYSIAVARHALTRRSKDQRSRSHGYENRHGRTVASDHVLYSAHQYAAVLPATVAGVRVHVDTTACFLVIYGLFIIPRCFCCVFIAL